MEVGVLLDMLFPRFCAGCGQEGSAWCEACDAMQGFPRPDAACPFCHEAGSDRTCNSCRPETYLDGVSGIASYTDPTVRTLIQSWKYASDTAYGNALAQLVHAHAKVPEGSWTITHVPLHRNRRLARGFDQAEEIGTALASTTGFEARPLVTRIHASAPRALLAHESRLVGDMDALFAYTGGPIVPERVLLVDDVFTSGATMDASAKVLKEAGVKEVWGFVVARAT